MMAFPRLCSLFPPFLSVKQPLFPSAALRSALSIGKAAVHWNGPFRKTGKAMDVMKRSQQVSLALTGAIASAVWGSASDPGSAPADAAEGSLAPVLSDLPPMEPGATNQVSTNLYRHGGGYYSYPLNYYRPGRGYYYGGHWWPRPCPTSPPSTLPRPKPPGNPAPLTPGPGLIPSPVEPGGLHLTGAGNTTRPDPPEPTNPRGEAVPHEAKATPAKSSPGESISPGGSSHSVASTESSGASGSHAISRGGFGSSHSASSAS